MGAGIMTDIVNYKGVKYQKDFRCGSPGDLIIITQVQDFNGDGYELGDIFKVQDRWSSDTVNTFEGVTLYDSEYAVLDEVKTSQTDRDLIIELAYTVAKLERRVERLEKSLEKTDEKAEMLIDDVVMLDERTQPLTDDGAKEFAEGLSEVIEEYVNDRMNSEQLTKEQIRRVYA